MPIGSKLTIVKFKVIIIGLDRIIKGLIGGLVGYAAMSLLVPYYSSYATLARTIGTGTGVYIGATYKPSASSHSKAAH